MYMVWSSVGFPKNQILKAGFEFSEFIWEMIQISAGRGVGSETDEERSLAKDILISRSLIWATGSPLGSTGNLQRVHAGLPSSRAKDTRAHLSTNCYPPLVEGYSWEN